MNNLVPVERIENKIFLIRGQKVMLDMDLAELYLVPTKVLNQAVRRNIERFPDDFMFQLTWEEVLALRSQIVTSNRGGRRYLPYAFTEHGVAMLSCILNSERAVNISILIIKAFVKLRQLLSTHKELARKIEELESRVDRHDAHILNIIEAIKGLMEPKEEKSKKIGFLKEERKIESYIARG